jgi:hypothetical protein
MTHPAPVRLTIKPGLLTQTVYEEAVIVSTQNAMITSLNASGTFLFDLLHQRPHTEIELLAALLGEFEVTQEEAAADLRAFLEDLKSNELIIAEPADAY